MTTICVTGVSGFVGERFSDALKGDGRHVVVGMTRAAGALAPNQGMSLVHGDLLEPASLRAALSGVDTVVHLAAATGNASARDHIRINRDGTRALLAAAEDAGVRRFLFVSTIAVNFPDLRRYPYAQSKKEAEQLVAASSMATTVVRPTIVTGPGSPIVAALRKLAGLPVVPIFGSGRVRVQPIHVDDLAALLADVVRTGRFHGETLEFGGPEIISMDELLLAIRNALGKPRGRIVHIPLGPVLPVIAAAEAVAGSAIPVTVGQLASFRFDGVARNNSLFDERRGAMKGIPEMMADSISS